MAARFREIVDARTKGFMPRQAASTGSGFPIPDISVIRGAKSLLRLPFPIGLQDHGQLASLRGAVKRGWGNTARLSAISRKET